MRSAQFLFASLLASLVLAACDDEKKKPTPAAPKPATSAAKQPVAAPYELKTPKGLPDVPVPPDKELTAAKVELGHLLFFDKRLSVDGSRACYTCHQNENGNGGKEPLAIGAEEKKLTRHSPVIWNVAYLPQLYWDGRSDSLEAQMKGAWGGGNMGVGKDNLGKKAEEIGKIAGYAKRFEEAFPGKGVTPDTIAEAVSAYERTLLCGDTAYDKFSAGDKSAMTDEQQKGWELFTGKAACNSCHTPPHFSNAYAAKDGSYHNVGIGTKGVKKEEVDEGRMAVSKNPSHWAAFKTPTLRNISRSAPYFHDGSVDTLEAAVKLMAGGGIPNDKLDPLLKDRKLTDDEIAQLVAFLKALDCPQKLEEPKELPK